MTSQNQNPNDAKTPSTPGRDAAVKPAEPLETGRELTEQEIAAVAGGTGFPLPKKQ